MESHTEDTGLHPLIFMLLLILAVLAGFVIIGPLIGFMASLPFYEGNIMSMVEAIQDPLSHPEMKLPFFLIQGGASLVGLIVTPILVMMATRRQVGRLFDGADWNVLGFVMAGITVVIFMGFNSLIVEWNANVSFPEALSGFESWAREKEDLAAQLTEFMTRMDSTGEFILALVVIAVIPAIGEELVFRGLLQTEFTKVTRNPHVAIALSALMFSAMHMQFFGFVPRFLLGALFGYLYYWSGNLMISMLAHFVNNGVAVLGMYLYQRGVFTFDVESTESMPLSSVLFSAVATTALLYFFYRQYQRPKANLEL